MARKAFVSGYTLLELLFVLLLMSLVTGLVAPRLATMYDSTVAALEIDDIMFQLRSLGERAFRDSTVIILDNPKKRSTSEYPLKLPDGWTIHIEQPITYRNNGICGGGKLTLNYGKREYQIQLKPPHCKPQLS